MPKYKTIIEFLKEQPTEILFEFAKEIDEDQNEYSENFREFAAKAYESTGFDPPKIMLIELLIFSYELMTESLSRGYPHSKLKES